jgi:hypothetical protein
MMTRQHPTAKNLLRRLRPAPERFAAAAALQDPSLLMQAQAARPRRSSRPAATSPCAA